MPSNLEILSEIKTAIFVEEILSKTRKGGLPWTKDSTSRYSVTICEPALCNNPYEKGESWTYNITKLPLGSEYIYVLDVLASADPYLHADSRQVDTVQSLFQATESVFSRPCRLNRALEFIGKIPTAPETDVSDFVMCGGVEVGGTGRIQVNYYPKTDFEGGIAAGTSLVGVTFTENGSGGASLDGTAVVSVI